MASSTATDVLIIGCGMSGLSAAIVCAEAGRRTLIVEKSDSLGGSAMLSAGMFWAPRDVASAHSTIPFGDPTLQETFIADYLNAVQWMRDQGVDVSLAFHGIMSIGIGYPFKIMEFIDKAEELIFINANPLRCTLLLSLSAVV